MKHLLAFALVLATPSAALACNEVLAVRDLELYLLGGMSGEEAMDAIASDFYFDGTRKCLFKIRGYARQHELANPNTVRLLNSL